MARTTRTARAKRTTRRAESRTGRTARRAESRTGRTARRAESKTKRSTKSTARRGERTLALDTRGLGKAIDHRVKETETALKNLGGRPRRRTTTRRKSATKR